MNKCWLCRKEITSDRPLSEERKRYCVFCAGEGS
jgi:hypothetical protein